MMIKHSYLSMTSGSLDVERATIFQLRWIFLTIKSKYNLQQSITYVWNDFEGKFFFFLSS